QWVGPVEPTSPIDTVSAARAVDAETRHSVHSSACAARANIVMVPSGYLFFLPGFFLAPASLCICVMLCRATSDPAVFQTFLCLLMYLSALSRRLMRCGTPMM